jgi:phenylalanyl-tRNA synthetase beta chain
MGEIHPDFAEELDVPPFLLFELDFDMLLQYGRIERTYCPLPRFPSVQRDVALVVDESLPAHTITAWIRELQHPVLKDVELFDDYRGPSIPEGKKSLAYTLSYRALDRTLTDTEVNAVHEEMITRITNEFGAQPRT